MIRQHIVCDVCHRDLSAGGGLPEAEIRREVMSVRLVEEYREVNVCKSCWTKPIHALAEVVRGFEREYQQQMRASVCQAPIVPMGAQRPTP